jgi:hypothetical protein
MLGKWLTGVSGLVSWRHDFPDPGKLPGFACSSPPSDTQSGGTSPFLEHRLNTRTPRLMPAASPRR